jgi:hypothetical protein
MGTTEVVRRPWRKSAGGKITGTRNMYLLGMHYSDTMRNNVRKLLARHPDRCFHFGIRGPGTHTVFETPVVNPGLRGIFVARILILLSALSTVGASIYHASRERV